MKYVSAIGMTLVILFGVFGGPVTTPTEAQSDRLAVMATYSILGDVVASVAGDVADVDVLMPLGADPHNFVPSGTDLALMEESDVIFSNGAGFEEGVLEVLEAGDFNHVIASMCVPIWDFEATYGGHDDEDHGDEDHGDEDHGDEDHGDEDHGDEDHGDEDHGDEDHGDEDHADHEHSAEYEAMETLCNSHFDELAAVRGDVPAYWEGTLGPLYSLECGLHSHEEGDEDHADEDHADEGEEAAHDHGNCDPHVWLDPYTGWLWAYMVRDTLSELDPDNAAVYAANAEAFIAELNPAIDELDVLYNSIPDDQRVLIANHRVLGYVANPYGFEAVFAVIPGGGTGSEPSAQDIVELIEIIEDEGVRAIFSEVTVNPTVVERIADETGAQVVQLYTESLSDPDGPAPHFVDLLLFNATAIVGGLSAQ